MLCELIFFKQPEQEFTEGKRKLLSWLNQQMKINLVDGRILIGTFVCTDKDAHIILSTCYEYFNTKGNTYC